MQLFLSGYSLMGKTFVLGTKDISSNLITLFFLHYELFFWEVSERLKELDCKSSA